MPSPEDTSVGTTSEGAPEHGHTACSTTTGGSGSLERPAAHQLSCPSSGSVEHSSAEVRGLVIHDIKEVEGVRQQEEQEDKRDEEIGDEVNGEVEEVTQRAHET